MGVGRNKFQGLKNFEIEIQKRRKPAARETFLLHLSQLTQIIHGIVNELYNLKDITINCKKLNLNEIKIQQRRESAAGEPFLQYRMKFYHSRTQIISGIVNAIYNLK